LVDSILAVYVDSDDGAGSPATFNDVAVLDCVIPIISNVQVTQTRGDGFTVTFQTDEPAWGSGGTALSCGDSEATASSPLGIQHTLTFEGIEGCRTYAFYVGAVDSAGNIATDDNAGACYEVELTDRLTILYSEPFEPPPSGTWSSAASQGNDLWAVRPSLLARSQPNAMSFEKAAAPGGVIGVTDARLQSPAFVNPTRVEFWHVYQFEGGHDGGVMEIFSSSIGSWVDAEPYFIEGGYTGTMGTTTGNPLGGRRAWSSAVGEPRRTVVDLTSFSGAIRVRYRWASDNSVTSNGWWIDDFRMLRESVCPPNAADLWLDYE
jgi:hypothetical protein